VKLPDLEMNFSNSKACRWRILIFFGLTADGMRVVRQK
jgi:hypothetical protein